MKTLRFIYGMIVAAMVMSAVGSCSKEEDLPIDEIEDIVSDDVPEVESDSTVNREYNLGDNLNVNLNGYPDSIMVFSLMAKISEYDGATSKLTISSLPCDFTKVPGLADKGVEYLVPVMPGEEPSMTIEVEYKPDSIKGNSFSYMGENNLLEYSIAGRLVFDDTKHKQTLLLNIDTRLKKFPDETSHPYVYFQTPPDRYTLSGSPFPAQYHFSARCQLGGGERDGLLESDMPEEYIKMVEILYDYNANIFMYEFPRVSECTFWAMTNGRNITLSSTGFAILNNSANYADFYEVYKPKEYENHVVPFYYVGDNDFVIYINPAWMSYKKRIYNSFYALTNNSVAEELDNRFITALYKFYKSGVSYEFNYTLLDRYGYLTTDDHIYVDKYYVHVIKGEIARECILVWIDYVLDSEKRTQILLENAFEMFPKIGRGNDKIYTKEEIQYIWQNLRKEVQNAKKIEFKNCWSLDHIAGYGRLSGDC